MYFNFNFAYEPDVVLDTCDNKFYSTISQQITIVANWSVPWAGRLLNTVTEFAVVKCLKTASVSSITHESYIWPISVYHMHSRNTKSVPVLAISVYSIKCQMRRRCRWLQFHPVSPGGATYCCDDNHEAILKRRSAVCMDTRYGTPDIRLPVYIRPEN